MSATATKKASATPTITSGSAYTANRVVGTPFKLAGLLGRANSGLIQSALLELLSAQTVEFVLYIFSAQPIGTFTDNAAPVINAADIPNLLARIDFPTAYSELGVGHTHYEVNGIGKAIAGVVADLWGVLLTKGAPTFTSTTDVTITVTTLIDVL